MSLSSIDWDSLTPEQLNQPVEPWHPKPGDRVRVRVNGECTHSGPVEAMLTGDFLAEGGPHEEIEDGRPGVVVILPSTDASDVTHPYAVTYDEPFWSERDQLLIRGAHYAAAELEPLEEL